MRSFFEWFLATLDFFVPKDKNIIVFGANEMRGINGNVAAILRAWPKDPKTKAFKAYAVSVHDEKFPGVETIDPKSLRGIITLLRAHTAVTSHLYRVSSNDLYWLAFYNKEKRRVINLWHGSPLKRIGPRSDWNRTSVFIASSRIERLALSACTQLPLERILVTGFPRIDPLIKYPKKLREEALSKLPIKDQGAKWILYTPTHRGKSRTEGFLHRQKGFSVAGFKAFLKRYNLYLLVRPHPNDPFSDFPEDERIIFAGFNLFPEIEPLYALADILITDYSSSIFEYLLLNRPIIGFVPDLEAYEKKTGLLYDYEAIFPGPIATSWKQLQKLIEDSFKNPSDYKALRKDRTRLFNKFTDGKSTQRVINLICDLSIN